MLLNHDLFHTGFIDNSKLKSVRCWKLIFFLSHWIANTLLRHQVHSSNNSWARAGPQPGSWIKWIRPGSASELWPRCQMPSCFSSDSCLTNNQAFFMGCRISHPFSLSRSIPQMGGAFPRALLLTTRNISLFRSFYPSHRDSWSFEILNKK